jgi:hypothetical protein
MDEASAMDDVLEPIGSRKTVHGSRLLNFIDLSFCIYCFFRLCVQPTTYNVQRFLTRTTYNVQPTTCFERKYRRWTKLATRQALDEAERWTKRSVGRFLHLSVHGSRVLEF